MLTEETGEPCDCFSFQVQERKLRQIQVDPELRTQRQLESTGQVTREEVAIQSPSLEDIADHTLARACDEGAI